MLFRSPLLSPVFYHRHADGASSFPSGRTGQKKIPAGWRGFSKGVKLLLDVDNNAVTTVRPVPQKLRFCGNPVHFICSAEVNSACAEIFASQKYSYGAPRRPICDGAPGGRTGAKENPRRMAGIFQESKNYSSMSITTPEPTVRPIPQKLRFCGNPVYFTCSAEMNSACAEIFASQKYSYGAPRRPICDGAPGGRTAAKENRRRTAGIFQGSKITPRCR